MAAPFVIVQGALYADYTAGVCAGYILYPQTRPRRVARLAGGCRASSPAARAQRLISFENIYTRHVAQTSHLNIETCAVYHYALVCTRSDSPLFAHAAHYAAHVP